ncbi:MAG: hypothetical protein AUH84_07310 [Thaumarchaeota archaeon 13_1_40CM_4_38_7]|nr:MAG: hypothetical protein AUH84_07310 [Thaumarchaeota archaeon 13_1_40CM_4_38_7]OLC93466.1 MAG: hypothetical protein AUI92_02800 [Thaumarchaeota archaeon 13_1_40CM_3_38_6]
MGISIPISAEHYDKLKTISDKLGLGLKKTIEYLVLHYWEREIERRVAESKEVKPTPVESRRVKSSDIQSTRVIPNEVESRIVKPIDAQSKEIKPIRELLIELGREYDLFPSNITTSTSVVHQQSEPALDSDIGKMEDLWQAKAPALQPKNNLGGASTIGSAASHNEQDIIPSVQRYHAPSPEEIAQYCSSCGSPRRPNAKYCHNCGSLL